MPLVLGDRFKFYVKEQTISIARQKFVDIAANNLKDHGKSLKTPRQKFEDTTANVSKHHSKSLKIPRQKFHVAKFHG